MLMKERNRIQRNFVYQMFTTIRQITPLKKLIDIFQFYIEYIQFISGRKRKHHFD
jgi:hypothetical protein